MDMPEITNFLLPETGHYTIVVSTDIPLIDTTSETEPLFEFRLSLDLVPNVALQYGETKLVKAPEYGFDKRYDIFNFDGKSGDIVVVTVLGHLSAEVSLYDPAGERIAGSEDNYYLPYVLQATLTTDGNYIIHVETTYIRGDHYSISVSNQAGTSTYLHLNVDEPLSGSFQIFEGIAVNFIGEAGEVIALDVNIDEPRFEEFGQLILLTPDATTYRFGLQPEVYGLDSPPIVNFMLPQTGEYTLHINAGNWYDDVKKEIDYTLTLFSNMNEFPMITYGETLAVPLSEEGSVFPVLFAGHGGDVVTIQLDATSSTTPIYFQLYDPENKALIQVNLKNVPASTLTEYTLPRDGTYLILPAILDNPPDTLTIGLTLVETNPLPTPTLLN
jgi:hypothetical protein